MKMIALLILSLLLVPLISIKTIALPPEEITAEISEEADILAVFAAANKQQHPLLSTEKTNLDTLWIFLSDGSFRQFVIMDGDLRLFSCGTFTCEGEETDPPYEGAELGTLDIHRTQKYMEGAGFQDYYSVHDYLLHTGEYTSLFLSAGNKNKVKAVYGGLGQSFTDADGTEQLSDSWLLYYSDGSFEQYAIQDQQILLIKSGAADGTPEQEKDGMILLASD